tara:strand:- start:2085 stop:2201 length:117 start_codon:yes stop_codon:yes gene_type:complete
MENEGMSPELIEFILLMLLFVGLGTFSAMMITIDKDKK